MAVIAVDDEDGPLVHLPKGALPCVVRSELARQRRGDNGGSAHLSCPASRRTPPGLGGGYPARPQSDPEDIGGASRVDGSDEDSPSRRVCRGWSYMVVDVVVTGGEEWREECRGRPGRDGADDRQRKR